MTDISQQAKDTLAQLARRKATERLLSAGAETTDAMQRRVLALAAERNLPAADYAKLLHKRVLTGSIMAFCEKHDVSTDWLLCGDLRALALMTQRHRSAKTVTADLERQWKELVRLLADGPRGVPKLLDYAQRLAGAK